MGTGMGMGMGRQETKMHSGRAGRSDSTQHSPRNDTGATLPGSASGTAFRPCLWLCNTTEPPGPQRS